MVGENCHVPCSRVVALVTQTRRVVEMRVFESDPERVLVHLEDKQFQRLLVVLAVVVILEVLELLHRCTVLVIAVGVLSVLVR